MKVAIREIQLIGDSNRVVFEVNDSCTGVSEASKNLNSSGAMYLR